MKYIKKPIEVEAVYYSMLGFQESPEWLEKAIKDGKVVEHMFKHYFDVVTLEGIMRGSVGNYIIRGVEGELYPCDGNIFEKTYDRVIEDGECEACSI